MRSLSLKPVVLGTLITTFLSTSAVAQLTPNSTLQAPSPSSGPIGAQIGGSTAYVPMKHGSCGLDCGTHVLATQSGNLNMKFKVGMICPAGKTVNHVSYRPQGHNIKTVIDSNTNTQSFSQIVTIQPFSVQEFEKAGQEALGGSWPLPNPHNNRTATVKKTLQKSVEVWGQCSEWGNKQKKSFPVTITVTFEDKSFVVPVR